MDKKSVYFSVIIPVYNVEKYLKQCVDSVLSQSCDDFEIILVDDGSTDSSGEICNYYAQHYSCVHVIHKKNGGLSSSRNTGLRAAVGKYVLFLDSDDFYSKLDILQNIKQMTQVNNYDFVLFRMAKYYTDDEIIDYYGEYDAHIMEWSKVEIFSYIVRQNKQLATACNKAIRRELLCERQIFFPLGTISEDVPWVIRLFEESCTIGIINSIAYMYRQKRKGSISSEVSQKKIEQLFNIVKSLSQEYIMRNDEFGKTVMSFTAYEFAIVLYLVALSSESIDTNEIQEYCWLLKYAKDRKTCLVKWVYTLLGFKKMLRLMRLRKRT